MSKCPKCGRKLHLYNVSQFCPGCGVNLRFYNFRENFLMDAKEAELKLARMNVKLRRMKVSFLGSKLAIFRLIAILFPVLGLLIPSGSVSMNLPFYKETIDLSALGIYNAYSKGDIMYILKMSFSDFAADQFTSLRNILIGYASVALVVVIALLATILCFISYKNMQKVIAGIAVVGIADSIAIAIMINHFTTTVSNSLIVSAEAGFGLYIEAVMFAIVFVANLLLCIKKIPIEYEEGDLERYEILKKVIKGEIKIEELPQPIVETAETRAIEEEIKEKMKNMDTSEEVQTSEEENVLKVEAGIEE